MSTENLPDCPCGANQWEGGGGQFGPGYQFYGRHCESCGNILHYVGREGWGVILIAPKADEDALVEFINTSMAIQARAYKAVWREVADKQEKAAFDALCREWGLYPDKGVKYTYLHDLPKVKVTHTRRDGSTYEFDELQTEYRDSDGNKIDVDTKAFSNAVRDLPQIGPCCVRAPDVVNLPDGVTAYVMRDGNWDLVELPTDDVNELLGVRKDTMPADPLRVSWDAYFDKVFEQVVDATGVPIARMEIPNRYYDDKTKAEPWWQFKIGDKTIIVGPRKRVINIQVESDEPFDPAPLKALGERDNVTFSSHPPWWDATTERAKDIDSSKYGFVEALRAAEAEEKAKFPGQEHLSSKVFIHAWNQDKCVEYLAAAVKMAFRS